MISSRNITDLLPCVQRKAQVFKDACKKEGIDIIFTSTYRDNESQNALYAQGRSKPGNKVTNAKGGQSFHNYRCAFDFAPVVNGKIDWTDLDTFKKCGAIAEANGLEWAGRWVRFKEMVHCQYTGGLTIHDLLSGKVPQ